MNTHGHISSTTVMKSRLGLVRAALTSSSIREHKNWGKILLYCIEARSHFMEHCAIMCSLMCQYKMSCPMGRVVYIFKGHRELRCISVSFLPVFGADTGRRASLIVNPFMLIPIISILGTNKTELSNKDEKWHVYILRLLQMALQRFFCSEQQRN